MGNFDFSEFEELVFSSRFGLMTKTELELELLRVFLSHESNEAKSNFEIGRMLGITEGRVSSMRMKLSLLNREEPCNPKNLILGDAVEIDDVNKKIILRIDNSFQRAALKDYLEKKGSIVDVPLGSKQIALSPAKYLKILEALLEDSAEYKEHVDRLARDNEELNGVLAKIAKGSLSETISDSSGRRELAMCLLNGFTSGLVGALFAVLRG